MNIKKYIQKVNSHQDRGWDRFSIREDIFSTKIALQPQDRLPIEFTFPFCMLTFHSNFPDLLQGENKVILGLFGEKLQNNISLKEIYINDTGLFIHTERITMLFN